MTATTDSTAQTSQASSTEETASMIEVPQNIDFQMDAGLKEVLFDKMTFTNMNGKLIVKNGKVDMTNLSMNTMGGSVVMNGILFDRRSEEAGNERRIPYGKYRFCTGLQRTGYGAANGSYL